MKCLKQAVEVFLEPNPYRRSESYDPDSGEYSLRLDGDPTPPEWGPIIGDVVHNLRSSLDHLVWQLTIANGKTPPAFPLPEGGPWTRVQFPICSTQGEFDRKASLNLWGIKHDARRYIEALQPLPTNDNATAKALRVLQELSNSDKHRRIHVAVSYLLGARLISQPLTVGGTLGLKPGSLVSSQVPGAFDDGAEVIRFTLDPPQPEMNMDLEIDVDIAFSDGTGIVAGMPVVETLTEIGAAVWKILKGAESLPGMATHDPSTDKG